MTKFLGPVVMMDIEGKFFHTTIDGENKKVYNYEQVLNGQHLIDNPGFNAASESAHFSAKPMSGMDRGAQVFSEEHLNLYIVKLEQLGRKHLLLPGPMAKRVMHEMGYESNESYRAWWHYCDTQPKIIDMVRELRKTTARDRRRNECLNASRADSCVRIDSLASVKYKHAETEIAREILARAYEAGAISDEVLAEFGIKLMTRGPRKGFFDFTATHVMPLYVTCCEVDGRYRRDTKGNPIGIDTVLYGILQHHPFKSGKGSKASARAKTRLRLRFAEERYRKEHKIPKEKGFPKAIPAVRKHHQRMNEKLVKIFRDYSAP